MPSNRSVLRYLAPIVIRSHTPILMHLKIRIQVLVHSLEVHLLLLLHQRNRHILLAAPLSLIDMLILQLLDPLHRLLLSHLRWLGAACQRRQIIYGNFLDVVAADWLGTVQVTQNQLLLLVRRVVDLL